MAIDLWLMVVTASVSIALAALLTRTSVQAWTDRELAMLERSCDALERNWTAAGQRLSLEQRAPDPMPREVLRCAAAAHAARQRPA